MPKVVLYGPIQVPFVTKVRGALNLKGVPFELVEPKQPEDYRRWNPETGLLPLIDVDGVRVADSAAILDHLDEVFPDPPLVSSDPKIAASQRGLESWVEETFVFYWTNYLREVVEGGDAEVVRRRAARPSGLGAEFAGRLDDLMNFLGDRSYFYGEEPGRADLAVYSFLANAAILVNPRVSGELDARKPLGAHLERVGALLGD